MGDFVNGSDHTEDDVLYSVLSHLFKEGPGADNIVLIVLRVLHRFPDRIQAGEVNNAIACRLWIPWQELLCRSG